MYAQYKLRSSASDKERMHGMSSEPQRQGTYARYEVRAAGLTSLGMLYTDDCPLRIIGMLETDDHSYKVQNAQANTGTKSLVV